MLQNIFSGSPSVGSNDYKSMAADLVARLERVEQQLAANEKARRDERQRHEEDRRRYEDAKPKKIKWSKIRKLFTSIIKPILEFIPKIINAVANYKKAAAYGRSSPSPAST